MKYASYIKLYNKLSLLFFGLVLLHAPIFGQSVNNQKKAADRLLQNESYKAALNEYMEIKDALNDNLEIKFKIAVCHYHLRQYDQALKYFQYYSLHVNESKPELYEYLAKSNFYLGKYREAAILFKNCYRGVRTDQEKNAFKLWINYALNAEKAPKNQYAFVNNIGSNINTSFDELNSIYSLDDKQLIFNSNRPIDNKEYSYHIYKSHYQSGNWLTPTHFKNEFINPKNYLIWDYSTENANYLFSLKNKIWINHLALDHDSTNLSQTLVFKSDPAYIDKDLSFVNDSIIIFASNRSGGYGGFDLYYTPIQNPDLRNATNLGHKINSPYDECTPRLSQDLNLLFFASNRTESMGGFDIFQYNFEHDSNVMNLGAPVNSIYDELYFNLNDEGSMAYFNSNRTESYGGFDIFSVYFKVPLITSNSGINFYQYMGIKSKYNQLSTNQNTEHSNSTRLNPVLIEPYFYNTDEINFGNYEDNLQSIAQLLKSKSQSGIALSAFSYNTKHSDQVSFSQSLNAAETFIKDLMDLGVDQKRIVFFAMNHRANVKAFNLDSTFNFKMTQYINNRLEFCFFELDSIFYEHQIWSAGTNFLVDSSVLYDYTLPGIRFSISSKSTDEKNLILQQLLDSNHIIHYSWKTGYQLLDKLYKNFDEVKAAYDGLTKKNPEIKIIIFEDGKEMPYTKRIELDDHPEISKYNQWYRNKN